MHPLSLHASASTHHAPARARIQFSRMYKSRAQSECWRFRMLEIELRCWKGNVFSWPIKIFISFYSLGNNQNHASAHHAPEWVRSSNFYECINPDCWRVRNWVAAERGEWSEMRGICSHGQSKYLYLIVSVIIQSLTPPPHISVITSRSTQREFVKLKPASQAGTWWN